VNPYQQMCDQSNFTALADPTYLATFEPAVYNVNIWDMRNDDGTTPINNGNGVTETDALAAIANLNMSYNKFNIFFKYRGVHNYNSTEWTRLYKDSDSIIPEPYHTISEFRTFVNNPANGVMVPNSFNIYVFQQMTFGGVGHPSNNFMAIKFQGLRGVTIVHETGHSFNLYHPSDRPGQNAECEHVTRDPNDTDDPNDPNDTYYNADIAGDFVVDTNAVSPALNLNTNNETYDTTTCLYTGTGTDCQDTPYSLTYEDMKNAVGNAYECSDPNFLTIGQGIRMREAIECDALGKFAQAETTIASLYEPYKGTYGVGFGNIPPTFQPGFDYIFVYCECPCSIPMPYGSHFFNYNLLNIAAQYDADETNYNTIVHPDHSAIIIQQLQDPNTLAQPERCYDTYNRRPSNGRVIKFEDNVPNANVTITQKDSLDINSPKLIEDLNPGLYNIEKNYNDGTSEETMIFKENE